MASPQKENGFTPIAHEVLEAIQQFKFTLNELKIILCVLRYTYGFNRKSHSMSLSFFENHTGLSRSRINKAIKNLVNNNVLIITKKGDAKTPSTYMFNKDYDTWTIEKYSSFDSVETATSVQNDTSVKTDTATSVQNGTSTSVQNDTQERNNIKKILNKDAVVKDPVQFYQETFLHMNMIQVQSLQEWVNDFKGNKEVINLAIEKTAKANPKKPFEYLEGILKRWHEKKLFTVEDVEIDSELFRMKNVIPMKRVSGGIDWEAFNVDD